MNKESFQSRLVNPIPCYTQAMLMGFNELSEVRRWGPKLVPPEASRVPTTDATRIADWRALTFTTLRLHEILSL